ncbi:MAG: hypothetical protein GWN71_31090, partial [Gammaproteobacteria bacterium]|nr:undecaprenyl-diphosphate phosphatase [Gemmatimonadota bacterium]NIU77838.1 hypothetical protein [Gammaproteobacteria bacterium]NIX23456.1 hypothetical protein [Actinomycetota bacterium]
MTYGEGLLLGIVQGLTEFLPISSSGHLVVAGAVVGLRTPGVLVEVVLHVATLVSVLIVYRKELIALARGLRQGARSAWGYVGLLAVGTVPAAIAGLALGDLVARAFESLPAVGVHFLLTGTVLWSSRFVSGGEGNRPTAVGAGGIGMAQALALLPGISRSGTTVTAALWLGVT